MLLAPEAHLIMDDVWEENDGGKIQPSTYSDIGFTTPLLESLGTGSAMVRSTRAMAVKMAKEGFAEGKSEQEKVEMQEGFDEGFLRGQKLGRVCGNAYRKCRTKMAEMSKDDGKSRIADIENCNQVLDRIETLFFLKFPEMTKVRTMDKDAGAFLRQEFQSELSDLLGSFMIARDITSFFEQLEALK